MRISPIGLRTLCPHAEYSSAPQAGSWPVTHKMTSGQSRQEEGFGSRIPRKGDEKNAQNKLLLSFACADVSAYDYQLSHHLSPVGSGGDVHCSVAAYR
jgi:hypothetical protein